MYTPTGVYQIVLPFPNIILNRSVFDIDIGIDIGTDIDIDVYIYIF